MKRFWNDESGQDLVEYSLLLGFLALGVIASYDTIRGSIGTIWTNADTALGQAATPAP